MSATLTVTLPPRIKNDLDKMARRNHTRKSEIVRDALKRYMAVREFEELRKMVVPKAQKAGFFTDEDVFKAM